MNKSNLQGIYWMSLHGVVITIMVGIVKQLNATYSILKLIHTYSLLAFILVLLYLTLSKNWHKISTKRIKAHFLRSLMSVSGYLAYYYGINYISLASAAAISFLLPLCVCVLGLFFFAEEKLTNNRIISLLIGFLGVLLITTAGSDDINARWQGVMGILFSVFAWSVCDIITKQNGRQESVHGQIFYSSGFATLLTFPITLQENSFMDIDINHLPLLLTVSILLIMQLICIFKALQYGEFAIVMPFDYLRLPFGLMIGLLYFGESVPINALLGAAVIIASNYLLLYSERAQVKSGLSE